jgi:esterase/lipase superfamily enzyme
VLIDCKVVYTVDLDNKELVTSVETINYSSRKVLAMIIFKGVYHLRKHFENDIDSDTLFAHSPTGYLNDRLGLKYLEHFNKFTKGFTKGVYCMLIFDGYGSYLSQQFLDVTNLCHD